MQGQEATSANYNKGVPMIRHYCVYTLDTNFISVLEFIQSHGLAHALHLNRTRFWIDDSLPLHSELILRYPTSVFSVELESDHALGR